MSQTASHKPEARTGTRANRRSKRLPAAHRMLLTIIGPSGSEIAKEIVSTVEISQHGARVRGRRILRTNAEGLLTQLSSGRQARVRVAWQRPAGSHAGYLDSGVELLNGFDYWGVTFVDPPPAEDSAEESSLSAASLQILGAQELMEALATEAGSRPETLESVWCALIELLETREIISRADLVEAIRSLTKQADGKAAVASKAKK